MVKGTGSSENLKDLFPLGVLLVRREDKMSTNPSSIIFKASTFAEGVTTVPYLNVMGGQ